MRIILWISPVPAFVHAGFFVYLLDFGLSFHSEASTACLPLHFLYGAFMTEDELNLELHIPVQYFNHTDKNYHKNVDSICLTLIYF